MSWGCEDRGELQEPGEGVVEQLAQGLEMPKGVEILF